MKKIYYLSTCDTNRKILKELNPGNDIELQDIKVKNIDSETLDWIKKKVGSYEALFSKKAIKFRSLGLNTKNLTEEEYRLWLLEEYTFLKRPFIISDEQVFVGNTAKVIEEAKIALNQ